MANMTPDTDGDVGSVAGQVDPVVVNYLLQIQDAQHAKNTKLEKTLLESLAAYTDNYQPIALYRPLPGWAVAG